MDDIKKAERKRFEAATQQADWNAVVQGNPTNTVPVWIYSVNPEHGARLVTQLSVEGYRAACQRGGLPLPKGIQAWDVLQYALTNYEAAKDHAARLALHEELAGALLTYASHTKTWGMLPSVGQVQGIHVVVGDWNTRKAGRVFKPAAVVGRELLSRPDVVALLDQLIAAHTAKHPAEGPIRAR